jgi:hypothetical protein
MRNYVIYNWQARRIRLGMLATRYVGGDFGYGTCGSLGAAASLLAIYLNMNLTYLIVYFSFYRS